MTKGAGFTLTIEKPEADLTTDLLTRFVYYIYIKTFELEKKFNYEKYVFQKPHNKLYLKGKRKNLFVTIKTFTV